MDFSGSRSPGLQQIAERLLAALPEGLAVTRGQQITYANPAMARCFGYDHGRELFSLRLDQLIQPAELWLRSDFRDEVAVPREAWGARRDGTRFPVEFSQAPLDLPEGAGRVLLVRDITERRRLEQQYREAQKMQVVGRLVGGIVHDFNNLLTAVMVYAGMLLGRLKEGTRQYRHAQEIHRASERGAALAAQLLALARQQPAEPQLLDLTQYLPAKRELLQHLVGEAVVVKIHCASRLDAVRLDPAQLDQVLLNLTANARDAMPNGGQLSIEVTNHEVTPSFARSHVGLAPGRYVVMAVRDTGIGMDENTRAHLFEPFFTTKAEGRGTGLGLPTVYGIVAQAGGRIYVESEPGKGTEVRIFFPALQRLADEDGAAPCESSRCLLLVEDEALVRDSLQETLEGAGYNVLPAEDGPRALRLAGEHAGRLNLLITDMVMPGMNGRQVAQRVKELRPELPVIFISGYTAESQFEQMRAAGEVCLQKPFPSRVLVEAVRDAVGEPREAA